jgi:hypothetical protein
MQGILLYRNINIKVQRVLSLLLSLRWMAVLLLCTSSGDTALSSAALRGSSLCLGMCGLQDAFTAVATCLPTALRMLFCVGRHAACFL